MAYFLDNFPVSNKCAALELTEEQEKYCRVVYKLDDEDGASFAGFWNPEEEYSDEYVILPLRSTGATPYPVSAGTQFANVIGSTNDPRIGGNTWIKLWEDVANGGNDASCCCTDGKFYNLGVSGCSPKGTLKGGHVILNATVASKIDPGGDVYILPICSRHNSYRGPQGPGTGYYMKLDKDTTALILKGYFTGVHRYIDELKTKEKHE
ncbi:MAG: hypothetical protein ACI4JY_12300 [Oscillospiraceae bacterium]